ncbi:cob(I)yrinic acid a,c-diamide adenosyltransferase [Pyrococcus furiosus DSM 3638]|uniref:Cob(I)yrinic acid a,c-diamide adenosyltransferase n=3 Tax=Pyrococcus furiosus TaxID=2261 RepID=A0A5C0XS64_PYRFU|nr:MULTISPECIES: cob(I)yrinic acid a,c-diamide adenosyltransferase [Pyrococcus]AAL82162.1 cob(i)alamin adenosyltransferase [Pyrococcus furiosus DSM 3638]AFN04605.1 cob(I)alamin adenolsyltransferase/cobinamide ATP-dependent adenolsyltransferase [Pyrococcus furiosus COM1]MDK2870019.1 cob(I)alamin adenosyltransferase [Pyrococcus sp.]QEK79629.1 cob(I)yrinic acid a,c-diamide adenosyltransferase [Pyrococcus furiosus DSM 3638]
MSWKEKLGLVHIYTGNGKGKTTAALGLALRMLGSGGKVIIVQFLKAPKVYGEYEMAQKCGFTIESYGLPKFVHGKPDEEDIKAAKKALERAKEVVKSGEWDLVILDEICVALGFGMISIEEVKELILNKAKNTELVLTGRYCPEELFELADYVTEMKEVKHPYQRGILARRGIEY